MENEEKAIEVEIKTIKTDSCPSLSKRSTLTYEVGIDEQEGMHLRVVGNSGGGYYSQRWVAYEAIEPLLSSAETFAGTALRSLFQGTSVNTAGFVMAALKHLGVVSAHPEQRQAYVYQMGGTMRLIDLCTGSAPDGQASSGAKGSGPAQRGKKGTPPAGPAKP